MGRFFPSTLLLLAGWYMLGIGATRRHCSAAESRGLSTASWATERVELVDGGQYEGFLESEDSDWVRLIVVQRPPGQRMYLLIHTFDRPSVAKVVRLQPQRHREVGRWIERFRNRARIEAGRMEAVRLEPLMDSGSRYQRYRGRWFTLDSTADEATTRRIVVRVEQIFTAYRQILPPRTNPQRPLRLVVLSSMDEYHAYLARMGLKLQNPACFIQDRNLVVVGSELARYAAELAKVNQRHDQLRGELQQLDKDRSARLEKIGRQLQQQGAPKSQIAKLLTREKRRFAKQIQEKSNELSRCDRENAEAFQHVAGQMFARLYHEAFHAFLENYVYPSNTYRVPPWLNEGLAVLLEGGLLESGMLRVDAPNREALRRLQADLATAEPLPLGTLLAAGQQAFALDHDADRYYAHAWGLAYYLAFEKHLLSSPALEEYIQQLPENASPVERFQTLVGMPVAEFQQQWREYVGRLR